MKTIEILVKQCKDIMMVNGDRQLCFLPPEKYLLCEYVGGRYKGNYIDYLKCRLYKNEK